MSCHGDAKLVHHAYRIHLWHRLRDDLDVTQDFLITPTFIHPTILRMTSFDPEYLCIAAPTNAPPHNAEISKEPSLSIHQSKHTKRAK